MSDLLPVEVVYGAVDTLRKVSLQVPAGVSLGEAIERSGLLKEFPQLDLLNVAIGVHGRLRRLQDTVAAGDRIEIYRPLIADPKVTRRARARRR